MLIDATYLKYPKSNLFHFLKNSSILNLNQTLPGVPGHVRKPFCAASTPRECTVSWEEPTGGGPVEGYKVVAKSNSKLLCAYFKIFFGLDMTEKCYNCLCLGSLKIRKVIGHEHNHVTVKYTIL